MRDRRFTTPALLILTALLLLPAAVSAMPSLDPKDMLEITADVRTGLMSYKVNYAILRDANSYTDFYYLPGVPMLCEKDGIPEFTLVKFQDRDKEDKEKLVEGGFLQFACQLDIPEATKDALTSGIASQLSARAGAVKSEIEKIERFRADRLKKDPTYVPSDIEVKILQEKKDWYAQVSTLKAGAINLKRMPFKKSEVQLFKPTDLGGDMIGSVAGPAIAPNYAGSKMPFSIMFKDKLAVNVFEALTGKSQTGIPVVVNYTFQGLSPTLGFKVTVDWDICYQFFSTDLSARVSAAYGPMRGKLGVDYTNIRDSLETKKGLKIEVTADPECFPREEITKMIDPIIARIARELLETQTPKEVEPSKAPIPTFDPRPKANPSGYPSSPSIIPPYLTGGSTTPAPATPPAGGTTDGPRGKVVTGGGGTPATTPATPAGGGTSAGGLTPNPPAGSPGAFEVDLGVSVAIKDVKKVRKGKETISYEMRQVIDRTNMAGGFIGIGAYPDKVRENCIVVVPRGGFESAFLLLPEVGSEVGPAGIKAIDLTVVPIKPDKTEDDRQTCRWSADTGAWTFAGKPRKLLAFPLQDLFAKFGADRMKKDARFKVSFQYTFQTGTSFTASQEIPMFTGDFAASAPMNDVVPVRFRFDGLTFRDMDPDFTLDSVKVDLTSSNRTLNPDWLKCTDGNPPPAITWFVKAGDPVTAKVQYKYKDIEAAKMNKVHNWKYNGINLVQPLAFETTKLTESEQAKLSTDTTKKLEEAAKKATDDLKAAAYVEAIKFGLKLPVTVKNITDADYESAGGQAPLGLDITLWDARMSEVVHSDSSLDTADDKEALLTLVNRMVGDKLPIPITALRTIANRALWLKY